MTLERLKFLVINPTKTLDTNLVLNPSFETGTTGWTTGGTNTITTSATVQRRGVYSCKCTYKNNDLLASYAITLTDTDHVASMDIYIPSTPINYEGTQLTLTWTGFTSGTVTAGLADMTIRDAWQRVHCHINPDAGDLSGTLTLSETGTNGDADEYIYIDGVQIEARNEPTTYFDGNSEYCYWNGQTNASTSKRRADSRRGGTLVNLEDYSHISSVIGLGMSPYTIHKSPTAGGRSLYQKTLKNDREFMFLGEVIANNYDELQTKRKALMDLLKPDLVTGEQEVTLRYMATDASGKQASEIVDIRCRLKSGALVGSWSKPTQEPITLMFEAYDDLKADGNQAVQLDYNDTLADANYIVKRDRDGVWSAMAGMTGIVRAIAQHPITKEIYAAGAGVNIGGDANADYLAKWNGSAWVGVVAGCNNTINALAFDSAGNLYIGGTFTDWGDANGDGIVKWDGSSLSSLGTGLNNTVSDIKIDNFGNVYVCGSFTSVAGGATNYIAKWDGSAWSAVGTDVWTGTMVCLAFDQNGDLYAGGNMTNVAGGTTDYIAFYDVSANTWSAVGVGLNNPVTRITIGSDTKVYIAGVFTNAGGVANADYLTVWDGIKYDSLGTGVNGTVAAANYFENKLYISGGFTTAGQITATEKFAIYYGSGMFAPVDIDFPGTPDMYRIFFDNQKSMYTTFSTTGDAETAGDDTVTNSGTSTRPKFTITGSGLLRQIVNTTNNKGVYFNNLTLLAGEVVTLDFENQTFTSTFRGNILSYILEGISTLDFTLEPGTNRITTFIDGTTDANTNATMEYKVRYWSLDEAKR